VQLQETISFFKIDKNGSGQAARTQQHTVRTAAAPKVKTLKGLTTNRSGLPMAPE